MKKIIIARFYWHIHTSGNLWFLKQQANACGGKITDETGKVVYDPGFEYSHDKFREHFQKFDQIYQTCIA